MGDAEDLGAIGLPWIKHNWEHHGGFCRQSQCHDRVAKQNDYDNLEEHLSEKISKGRRFTEAWNLFCIVTNNR